MSMPYKTVHTWSSKRRFARSLPRLAAATSCTTKVLLICCVLFSMLLVPLASSGQQQARESTFETIKSQVTWLKSMVSLGKIDPQAADAQIKALQLQAGALLLNSGSLPDVTPAAGHTELASVTKPQNPANAPAKNESNSAVEVARADATSATSPGASAGTGEVPDGGSPPNTPAPAVAPAIVTQDKAICGTLCDLGMTHFRGLIGVNVAGASGADPSAKFYASTAFEQPLGGNFNGANPAWLSLWGNFALSSIAQPGSLSGVTDPYSYLQTAVSASPQQIVQSIESQVGIGINPSSWRWFHSNSDSMQTLSFIAGGGVITPLSPSQATPSVYVVTQDVISTYLTQHSGLKSACNLDSNNMLPSGQKCYLAVYPQDRTRFFSDYGAGVRLKFYWTDSDGNTKWMRFPGNIDAVIGQSQYVTGGNFKGAVLHVGGAMPIIAIHGLYAFGSMDVALGKGPSVSNQPLLLQPPSGTTVSITDPSVVAIQVPQPNRDRYSIGMGIDIVDFINHFGKSKSQ